MYTLQLSKTIRTLAVTVAGIPGIIFKRYVIGSIRASLSNLEFLISPNNYSFISYITSSKHSNLSIYFSLLFDMTPSNSSLRWYDIFSNLSIVHRLSISTS